MSTTELSFLISLLLDQKLSRPVQQLVKARIKEIEGHRDQTSASRVTPQVGGSQPRINTTSQQAPSTQALEQGRRLGPASVDPALPVAAPRFDAIDPSAQVIQGKGIKGPRKF